ncbi:MAG: hypothetical protein NZ703_10295 [Gemmataceae bacterium]|nr:hypothetical protein [Gemmataceae bacterium]MDW8244821.1 hypothetical protein [Thermogemmata sp.]
MTRSYGLASRLSLAGVLAVWTWSSAVAAPVTVTFNGVGPGYSPAGQYNWTSSGTIAGLVYSSGNNFATFCIEQTQYITPGTTYQYQFAPLTNAPNPGPVLSVAQANALRAMWAQYRSGVDTNDEAAAFQHAVWHIVDPLYNPSLSGSVLSFYNQYLNSATWTSGYANLAAMVHPHYQDHIVEIQRGWWVNQQGDLEPIPAPASLVVGLLLGVTLLAGRRYLRPAVS